MTDQVDRAAPLWKRNRDGSVAHHYDCARAKNGWPWYWPENTAKVTTDEELLAVLPPWTKPCSICFGSAPQASR